MGHGNSVPKQTLAEGPNTPNPKKHKTFNIFLKSLKKLTKHGLGKRRKNKNIETSKPISALALGKETSSATAEVIVGTASFSDEYSKEKTTSSHHSPVTYALSKLAVFAELSREKIASKLKRKDTQGNFTFHDHTSKHESKVSTETKKDARNSAINERNAAKDVRSPQVEVINSAKEIQKCDDLSKKIIQKKSAAVVTDPIELPDKTVSDCKNNNDDGGTIAKSTAKIKLRRTSERVFSRGKESFAIDKKRTGQELQDAVVRRILSGKKGERKEAKTPEELYHKNLQKFEALLAFTATTSSEDDSDSVDENYNPVEKPAKIRASSKPRRIIATSKNRVEVDAYFLDWLKSLVSHKTEGSSDKHSSSLKDDSLSHSHKKERKGGRGQTKKPPPSPSTSRSHTPIKSKYPQLKGKIDCYKDFKEKVTCVKHGPCAGKGALAAAPPAYLDYGCAQSFPGAASRKGRDPVMDRLKNVDVVEQLTYLVPSGGCCGDGAGDDEDNCDYYAVCESCGEMEPVPAELACKLKGRKKKKQETTPVTYSRRQRFSFKNKEEENDEGPPFKYDPTMGRSCRCPCCVAGLRRNPNCGCKCCQTMGNARRMNSFDEIPVGKNPQIRKIPCPMEAYEKRMEECKKQLPGASGLYKFDICENKFERQVPRTPTPIIVEVPAPRGLDRDELMDIAKGLTRQPKCEGQSIKCCNDCCCDPCCCCEPCCKPEPKCEEQQPEPIYLPPIYAQCNPCATPCGNENNNNDNEKKQSSKAGTATGNSKNTSKNSGTKHGSSNPSGGGDSKTHDKSVSSAASPSS